tara:strand:- start:2746 stop:3114 length:369 start_codon:yes stop_codon:yes gene_type:complete
MIIFKNYFNNNKIAEISSMPSVDIINPKFTINNKNKKIYVKASKGNFIDKDLILLEENVYFESSDFKIYSDSVTFNRKNETANSKTKSKFESKGTMIISEGFKIKNQGDIIFFDGETSLILN